ncbi:hypothetical protein HDU76_000455 [Blyttiomyces sp. JEL0837]|nr:hypothetical protein HDU76_000455 [Blyttiomyces sp. JEL0837]
MKSFATILAVIASIAGLAVAAPTQQNQYPYGTSAVSVINTFHQETLLGGTRQDAIFNETFTVQFAVRNDAYVKQVGIRYSSDNWVTYNESTQATYTSKLNNNYELWTLNFYRDIVHACCEGSNPGTGYWAIAAFVSYNNGPRQWDPKNNYNIYFEANSLNPVRFLQDTVYLDKNTNKAILTGTARVYPFDQSKDFAAGAVAIRWTGDGWNSFQESPAAPVTLNQTWNWNIVLGEAYNLPKQVAYAIHYKSSAGEFWDNNSQRNYKHFVGLDCSSFFDLPADASTPLSPGIHYLDVYCNTELKTGKYQYALDNGAFVDGFQYNLNTSTVSKGLHTIYYKAYLEGDVILAAEGFQHFTV